MKIENENGEILKVNPSLEYDIDREIQNNNHVNVDKIIENNNSKLTVSELYTQKTGKSWENAKKEGLTDGSYENNLKLRSSLLTKNDYTAVSKSDKPSTNTFKVPVNIAKSNLVSEENKETKPNRKSTFMWWWCFE